MLDLLCLCLDLPISAKINNFFHFAYETLNSKFITKDLSLLVKVNRKLLI